MTVPLMALRLEVAISPINNGMFAISSGDARDRMLSQNKTISG